MRFSDRAVDTILARLGRRIAELRTDRHLTQEAFAARLGLQVTYLQRVEGGEQNVTVRTLVRFAASLGCSSVGELFDAPGR